MSGGQTERQAQLIQDFRPRVIMVTPSYMLKIGEELTRLGIDPRTTSLEIGIFGAEPWTEGMRAQIEECFGIDACDIYGLSEVIGPGVACECLESRDGPVIWEDHFFPEIIDPLTGSALPDGELGELVLTSLTKEALPVIRYRTRDLTRLLPPTARSMRRIARVKARSDDLMIIRGVNVYPSQIEELLTRVAHLSAHYQLELTRDGYLDSLTVRVECRAGVAADAREPISRELARQIKAYIGVTVRVVVHEAGALPRSEGKARRVVDLRG
jgi:phenylacetate-CoA ligase